MANTVTGKIKAISRLQPLQSRSGNQFTKQSVFLDAGHYDQDTGEYRENNLLLDFINHRGGDLSQQYHAGDRVRVSFRLRGRSWDSRTEPGKKEWGISVTAYDIEPFNPNPDAPSPQLVQEMQRQAAQQQAGFAPPSQPAYQPTQQPAAPAGGNDGLPF